MMICNKCGKDVPEAFAFCPYCGQGLEPASAFSPARTVGKEVGGEAEEKLPVVARSAMPKEEEYAGRYETEEVPAPAIRFSKNLSTDQEPAPAEPEKPAEQPKCAACGAPLRESAKFCNVCGTPVVKAEPPKAEEPAPVEPEKPFEPLCAACGSILREGAKFCNICGTPVAKPEPVKEETPAPAPAPEQEPIVPEQQPIVPEQKPLAAQQPAEPAQRPALKKCPLCGTVVPAEAKLCTRCGVAFRVPDAQQAPAQSPKCGGCGADIRPGAKFCKICGANVAAAPVPPAAKPAPEQKAKAGKKSKAPLVIALVLLLAVIGVVAAGFMTGWFGLAAPAEQIYDAAEKTIRAGGFEAEFSLDVPGEVSVEGNAQCVLDIDGRELTALVELEGDGQKVICGIYDGVAVVQDPYGYVDTMDVEYILDEVFDALEEDLSMDEALEEAMDIAMAMMPLDDIVDEEEALKCLKKCINSTSWLKENAGYSTENDGGVTMHIFEPKLGDLAVAGVEAMQPAFEDEDMYDEALDYLKDYKSEMNDLADVELVLGIKSGKLVELSVRITVDGETLSGEVVFNELGAADVDTDKLEDLLGSSDEASAMPWDYAG